MISEHSGAGSKHRSVLLGSMVVLALLAAVDAFAAPPAANAVAASLGAAARVVTVVAADRVVIDRGRLDGIVPNHPNITLHLAHKAVDKATIELDGDIRVARGAVIKLEDHATELKLSVQIEPVNTDAVAFYSVEIPPALVDDALTELAALHIELRALATPAPMYSLAELLAKPTDATRSQIRRLLLAEIKLQAELAKSVLTLRIEGGRFHGRSLAQAFVDSTDADVAAFLDFVRAFPGKYIGNTWKLVEVYATWIINRTPDGDAEFAERKAKPILQQAENAAADGQFAEANDFYRAAAVLQPASKSIKREMANLEKIRVWQQNLAKDPDDTETRFSLMVALYGQRAYGATAVELARLDAAGYKPETLARYRGYLASGRKEYAKAADIFETLLQKDKDNTILKKWAKYCREMQHNQSEPKSYAAAMALAEVKMEEQE